MAPQRARPPKATQREQQQQQQQRRPLRKRWIGIDGTRHGWCGAIVCRDEEKNDDEGEDDGDAASSSRPNTTVELFLCSSLFDFLRDFARRVGSEHDAKASCPIQAIAIDIPIGLNESAQRGGRGCDRAARRVLAEAKTRALKKYKTANCDARRSLVGPASVFTPPSRPALHAFAAGGTHEQVSQANRGSGAKGASDATGLATPDVGLGLSIQSYNIIAKIKETDALVEAGEREGYPVLQVSAVNDCSLRVPAFECHPELAFLAMASRESAGRDVDLFASTALQSKKAAQGRQQRITLLRRALSGAQITRYAGMSRSSDATSDALAWEEFACKASVPMWPVASASNTADEMQIVRVPCDDVLDALACAVSSMHFSAKKTVTVYESDESRDNGAVPRDARGLPMVIIV